MRELPDISNSELCTIIDEWVRGKNAERNRAMYKRYLIDGLTYERLAEEFDLSVRYTQTVIYKVEKVVNKHIK